MWNGFLLEKARSEEVKCRFCGGRDGDGHLLGACTMPAKMITYLFFFLRA